MRPVSSVLWPAFRTYSTLLLRRDWTAIHHWIRLAVRRSNGNFRLELFQCQLIVRIRFIGFLSEWFRMIGLILRSLNLQNAPGDEIFSNR
jgi:hypothetical protein